MKKISVIIPVYNGEKYIEKCLNSIFNQSYTNYEIVCVNDQSTDNSLNILKKFKKNKNLIIVNQKNTGQAGARNNGINKCTGDYVTFVDQDDYIDKNYLENLINNIDDNDILISGYTRVDENDKILYKKLPSVSDWDKYKFCASWGKLYKSKLIKDNNIKFGNYKIGEDVYFLLQACSFTKKIKSISYSGYNNLRNHESVSNNINKTKNQNKLMPMLKDMIQNINFENFNKDNLLNFFLKTVVHYLYNQRKNCSIREYNDLCVEYFQYLDKLYMKYNKKIKCVKIKNEELKINLLINMFIIFKKIRCLKILLFFIKILTPKTNK